MLKMTFQRKSKRLIPSAIELFQVKISLSYCKISTKTIWILRQRATTSQNSQIQLSFGNSLRYFYLGQINMPHINKGRHGALTSYIEYKSKMET